MTRSAGVGSGIFGLRCLDGPPHPGVFIREKILDELGL
jgi:hypothetical protein